MGTQSPLYCNGPAERATMAIVKNQDITLGIMEQALARCKSLDLRITTKPAVLVECVKSVTVS